MMRHRITPPQRRGSGPVRVSRSLDAGQTSGLNRLQQRAFSLARLQQALWPALPTRLREHCQLANLRSGCLVVTADSSLWAAQARHYSNTLLRQAKQLKLRADRVEVRVLPAPRRLRPAPAARQLSAATSEHLHSVADRTTDPELQAILQRIANRTGNR